MKFLCIECNQAMKLTETRGPEDGSLSVIFSCPDCHKSIGMLTNPMETQMVRSLGVSVGGRSEPAQPMETLRTSLNNQRVDLPGEASQEISEEPATESDSGSGCPFSGMVADALEKNQSEITWTAEAEERLERIPSFVRPMVRKSIEQHAGEKGYSEINAAVMEEMKHLVGMKYP